MASRRRPNQFHVHLSNEEQRLLYQLAETDGVTASDWVRAAIEERARREATRQLKRRLWREAMVNSAHRAKKKGGKR